MADIKPYFNSLENELNFVGEQPWSMKEPMITNFSISKEIPEIGKFNISIPIESQIFVEKLAMAENGAMQIILNKRMDGLSVPVMSLINKTDYREIHNHLLVIFCKESERRKLLSNWKLKRFIVDVNYIFSHWGLKTLRYCDRNVRVSQRAIAIVKSMGEPRRAQIERYRSKDPNLNSELRRTLITIKNPQTKPNVLKRARIKLKRMVECSKSSRTESGKIDVYKGEYVMPNPVQKVSQAQVLRLQKEMDEIDIPTINNIRPDEDTMKDCAEALKLIIKQNAKKSYKEMLMKEIDEKLKELVGYTKGIAKLTVDIDAIDINKEYIINSTFEKFNPEPIEEMLGYDMFKNDGDPCRKFLDFVNVIKNKREEAGISKEKFEMNRERNYQRHKLELREEWADVYFGMRVTVAKLYKLKKSLEILRIRVPKVQNYNWEIVMSDYFKNEAIKRSIKDLEFRKKNFNSFKLDRCRKQRARSIIDDFFGTSSVCSKKRRMYGCGQFINDDKTLFIMRGADVIMQSVLNSNYMGVQKVRIEDYFEEIPNRRFTRKGVEIRDVEFITHVSRDCKRKLNQFVDCMNEESKKSDIKYGEMDPNEENRLLQLFMSKVDLKKTEINSVENEVNLLQEEIEKCYAKIKEEEMKSEKLVFDEEVDIDERVNLMFSKIDYDEEKCRRETAKSVKKEKKEREELIKSVPVKDSIDILNGNIEDTFNLRSSIIIHKNDFDRIVNAEISSIGLLPTEIASYRSSRLSEEIDKMNRYNERVSYLRATDPNNPYTKDLILMRFLRYQTLSRNRNIGLECGMEERMFDICRRNFDSSAQKRIDESKLRYKNRIDECIDKRIIELRDKMERERKEKESVILKDFLKKEKERLKKKVKRFDKPDPQVIKKLENLIGAKKEVINNLELKKGKLVKNLECFKLQKPNIMITGHKKEIIECKREKIMREIPINRFKSNYFKVAKLGDIVEDPDSIDGIDVQGVIDSNLDLVKTLMFRDTERINKFYKDRERKRYEEEKKAMEEEMKYGKGQISLVNKNK